MSQNIGSLETAAPVTVVKSGDKADLVELLMWRKDKGFGRIWYNQFGENITGAVLTKEFMQAEPKFEVLETKEDPLTGLTWQKVKLPVWIAHEQLIENIDAVWANAENTYKTQCVLVTDSHKWRISIPTLGSVYLKVWLGLLISTNRPAKKYYVIFNYIHLILKPIKNKKNRRFWNVTNSSSVFEKYVSYGGDLRYAELVGREGKGCGRYYTMENYRFALGGYACQGGNGRVVEVKPFELDKYPTEMINGIKGLIYS